MVSKFEKIAAAFIGWPFLGTILGLLFGALLGGRAGMVFVGLGFAAGVICGAIRAIWLGVNYNPNTSTTTISPKRLMVNRIFILFLYVFVIYTLVINIFFPHL